MKALTVCSGEQGPAGGGDFQQGGLGGSGNGQFLADWRYTCVLQVMGLQRELEERDTMIQQLHLSSVTSSVISECQDQGQ